MVDSAMFYLIGTLYPLLAHATYPTLGFPRLSDRTSAADDMKAQAPGGTTQRDRRAARCL